MKCELENVRLQWVRALTPKENKFEGSDRYEVTCLFEPDSAAHKAVKTAVEAVAKEKWGEKWEGILGKLIATDRQPIKDGNLNTTKDGDTRPEFEDMLYVRAYRNVDKGAPLVFNEFGSRVEPHTVDAFPAHGEGAPPQAGDYASVVIDVWAMDHPEWGRRINPELRIVFKTENGEPFGQSAVRESEADDMIARLAKKRPMIDTGEAA